MAFGIDLNRNKGIGDMSAQEFADYINRQNTTNDRLAQLNKARGGTNSAGFSGGRKYESESDITSNTVLGGRGGLGGIGDFLKSDSYKSLTDQAKDLARFRLGLDKDQAEFSYGLRDKEAEGNFGRQYKLDTQQRQFDRDINTDTQGALTQRLDKELVNRLQQQEKGINQENFSTDRAIRLASRRLGG